MGLDMRCETMREHITVNAYVICSLIVYST